MSDRREEILESCIVSGKIGNGEVVCEISEAKNAMDEYMKEVCLELLEYMAKNRIVCGIYSSPDGDLFRHKGRYMTKEQLFEDFL
jgi:hypothetical protein